MAKSTGISAQLKVESFSTPHQMLRQSSRPNVCVRIWRESLPRPDIEKLQDAGLLTRTSEAFLDGDALASELRGVLGLPGDEDEPEEDAA